MNNVLNPDPRAAVTLRGISIPLTSDVGGAFITDCSRNRERIMSDAQICEKYGISFDALTEIGQNPAVRLAVNAEHERRVRNGDAAKEAAAKLFADAPEVLGRIMNDTHSSPKHKIEAIKELRATANTGPEKSDADVDRVVITINLGGDEKLVFGPFKPNEPKEHIDVE
jgi:hypothetical protein